MIRWCGRSRLGVLHPVMEVLFGEARESWVVGFAASKTRAEWKHSHNAQPGFEEARSQCQLKLCVEKGARSASGGVRLKRWELRFGEARFCSPKLSYFLTTAAKKKRASQALAMQEGLPGPGMGGETSQFHTSQLETGI